MVYFCKSYQPTLPPTQNLKFTLRMVIEAFVYLQKRLKEDDEIRHKFDGSNILKRKGRAPGTMESLPKDKLGAQILADQIQISPAQLSPLPTIKKIQISVPTDPQNPEEAKKIVQRAINQDRLSGRNVFAGKGPIYVQTTTGPGIYRLDRMDESLIFSVCESLVRSSGTKWN